MDLSQKNKQHMSLITQVAEDLCQGEGFELVHVETVTWNRQTIIRIYADKPGGITLVSARLSAAASWEICWMSTS